MPRPMRRKLQPKEYPQHPEQIGGGGLCFSQGERFVYLVCCVRSQLIERNAESSGYRDPSLQRSGRATLLYGVDGSFTHASLFSQPHDCSTLTLTDLSEPTCRLWHLPP